VGNVKAMTNFVYLLKIPRMIMCQMQF